MLRKKIIKVDHALPILRFLNDFQPRTILENGEGEVGQRLADKLAREGVGRPITYTLSEPSNRSYTFYTADAPPVDLLIIVDPITPQQYVDVRNFIQPGGLLIFITTKELDNDKLVEGNLNLLKTEKVGKFYYTLVRTIPPFDSPNSEIYFSEKLTDLLAGPPSINFRGYGRNLYDDEEWKSMIINAFGNLLDTSLQAITIEQIDSLIRG